MEPARPRRRQKSRAKEKSAPAGCPRLWPAATAGESGCARNSLKHLECGGESFGPGETKLTAETQRRGESKKISPRMGFRYNSSAANYGNHSNLDQDS